MSSVPAGAGVSSRLFRRAARRNKTPVARGITVTLFRTGGNSVYRRVLKKSVFSVFSMGESRRASQLISIILLHLVTQMPPQKSNRSFSFPFSEKSPNHNLLNGVPFSKSPAYFSLPIYTPSCLSISRARLSLISG